MLFTDRVLTGTEHALDAVAWRQQVTSANIANASTPGYRARRVDFEADLDRAMRTGRDTSAVATSAVTTRDAGTPARFDGNSVALENETSTLMRDGLHYQALTQVVTWKLGLIRTAITGG